MSRDDSLTNAGTGALYALTDLGEPSTGNAVFHHVNAKSSSPFEQVTVYKALQRLFERGFVSYEERVKDYRNSTSRKVRYYTITDDGYQALLAANRLHEELRPISFIEKARRALRGAAHRRPLGETQ